MTENKKKREGQTCGKQKSAAAVPCFGSRLPVKLETWVKKESVACPAVNGRDIPVADKKQSVNRHAGKRHSGGDSVRVPPLPIPNREVKPHRADGTAKVGE